MVETSVPAKVFGDFPGPAHSIDGTADFPANHCVQSSERVHTPPQRQLGMRKVSLPAFSFEDTAIGTWGVLFIGKAPAP